MSNANGVFTVNFEHISHLVVELLLLNLNMLFIAGWVGKMCSKLAQKMLFHFINPAGKNLSKLKIKSNRSIS